LSTHTAEPSTEPIDRQTSPSAALPQHLYGQIVGEDDHRAAVVAIPPSASAPLLSQQSKAGPLVPEEDEWEIRKIVCKRRAGKGYEYKVRWKDTWVPRSELGNAKELPRNFEARGRAQGERKGGRPADRVLSS